MLNRRHLSTSQRAAIAANLLPVYEKEVKARQAVAGNKWLIVNLQQAVKGRATENTAKVLGVGESTMIKAKQIKQDSPKIFKRMKDGKLSVNKAQKVSFAEKMKRLQKPQGSKKVMVARDCFKVQYGMVDLNGNFTKGSTAKYFTPPVDSQEGIDMEWINSKFDGAAEEISERYEIKGK